MAGMAVDGVSALMGTGLASRRQSRIIMRLVILSAVSPTLFLNILLIPKIGGRSSRCDAYELHHALAGDGAWSIVVANAMCSWGNRPSLSRQQKSCLDGVRAPFEGPEKFYDCRRGRWVMDLLFANRSHGTAGTCHYHIGVAAAHKVAPRDEPHEESSALSW